MVVIHHDVFGELVMMWFFTMEQIWIEHNPITPTRILLFVWLVELSVFLFHRLRVGTKKHVYDIL